LARLAADDDRIVVIDGDLATSTRADIVADAVPEAFVQMGIAEQNMVGVAVGMSTLGYRPWLSTFRVFLTHRALDPIRMLVSQTKAPGRLAAAASPPPCATCRVLRLPGAHSQSQRDGARNAQTCALPNPGNRC
jgi:transketolase